MQYEAIGRHQLPMDVTGFMDRNIRHIFHLANPGRRDEDWDFIPTLNLQPENEGLVAVTGLGFYKRREVRPMIITQDWGNSHGFGIYAHGTERELRQVTHRQLVQKLGMKMVIRARDSDLDSPVWAEREDL